MFSLTLRRIARRIEASLFIIVFCFTANIAVANNAKANATQLAVSQRAAVAELSFKSVLYGQQQEDFLNAITDLLVAEKKGIWRDLSNETSKHTELDSHASEHDLLLVEASLYHYFGMEKEAESRYKQVTQNKSGNLSLAYLLLARYYYEQKSYDHSVKWLKSIDDVSLTEEQLNYKHFYLLDALLRLGKQQEAKELMSTFDAKSWIPVLEYNQQRTAKSSKVFSDSISSQPDWFTLNPETLSPVLKELQAEKELQTGIDAAKLGQWSNAVEAFKKVPSSTLRTIEARRWLAWSLMNDDQLETASKVWRSLTTVPAYQSLDAYVMASTTTEQLGDRTRALAWFQKGTDFYSGVVNELSRLRKIAKEGEWFDLVQASDRSFLEPVTLLIDSDDPLFFWTDSLWQVDSFQQLLADHRDLVQLNTLLMARTRHLKTFDTLIERRADAYAYTMRKVENLEADLRLDSYQGEAKAHNKRLDDAKDYKDIVSVGTHRQLINQALLDNVKRSLSELKSMDGYAKKHNTSTYEQRYNHLVSIQFWDLNESYPENFQTYQREVYELNERLTGLITAIDQMKSAAAFAPTRFEGFDKRVELLTQRLTDVSDVSKTLKKSLRAEAISMLDARLGQRQAVAQRYLEQSILASARLQDELVYELSHSSSDGSSSDKVLAGDYRK